MASVIVLGSGRVGAAMALDLAADDGIRVTAADADPARLDDLGRRADAAGVHVTPTRADLASPPVLRNLVESHDLVIGAVPGPMGFATARRVIETGTNLVDISFFEEDALSLDGPAREHRCVAVVDAGVAPGLSNLFLGHHEARLRRTSRFECLVGGIPAEPRPPWNYRAPFSPIDVLAEYTRPARVRRGGEPLSLPALTEVETVQVPGIGTLEAFNTDGLRTLLATTRTPDLVEKTLRWPGHADQVRLLRDTGFFDPEPVDTPAGPVAPLAVSSQLLFEAWRYEPGEADLTVMRLAIDGEDEEGPVRHELRLVDRYDAVTDTSSMARTTGYTATAIARLVLDGVVGDPGLWPPERLGDRLDDRNGALDRVVADLTARGIRIEQESTRP